MGRPGGGGGGLHTCACRCGCPFSVEPRPPREEGPFSETVYLPTCHVFAKTKILKEMSISSRVQDAGRLEVEFCPGRASLSSVAKF